MKENKGITIVALVITIVIMLILLGVTVTVVIKGDLIDTAKESNDETRYAQVLEQKEMWESEKLATDRFGAKAETLEEFVEKIIVHKDYFEWKLNFMNETIKLEINGNSKKDGFLIEHK